MSIERKYKWYKKVAIAVLLNMLVTIFYPTASYALTGGPSQPEVQSFEPIGTTEMVDLFTGDFTYNIPLFELPGPNGGYPFNLSYHSGITMDQEASWTGLGWNVNPGVINRQMRGLPDDFDGDDIKVTQDLKDNITFGGSVGAATEIFGADSKVGKSLGINGSLSIDVGVYYNNYKGVGYNLSPSLGFHKAMGETGTNLGLNLGLSLDSEEGIGFSPSLSVSEEINNNQSSFSVGANYSSKRGLTGLSLGLSGSNRKANSATSIGSGASLSASLGFAAAAHSPIVSQEMRGSNLSLKFKAGADVAGVFSNGSYSGYYNIQSLNNKVLIKKGYGYLNFQNASSPDMTDFNREKDGLVRAKMPHLAMPNLTYDIYSVAGQGTGGMYRPFRHDIGVIHDQATKSKVEGSSYGVEVGPGNPIHLGANRSINYSQTKGGKWEDDNALANAYEFRTGIQGDTPEEELFKPYQFKAYGEHTSKAKDHLDYIGGEEAVAVKLNGHSATSNLVNKGGTTVVSNVSRGKDKRTPANQAIAEYKNSEIKTGLLPLFNIKHNGNTALARRADHHIGGFIATNPNGLRYVYGLPAYNNVQEEYQFTVDMAEANECEGSVPSHFAENKGYKVKNTDKYFNKMEIPEYAHSYLLTSIVGQDYIDADDIEGPSEGDLGYWVKFNYEKKSSNYKWRAPFTKASYSKGTEGEKGDDKGSFVYGEKELWYLTSAETKTHVSIFHLSERLDGKGAGSRFNDDASLQDDATGSQYKIDKISLFTNEEYSQNGDAGTPIKEVHFEYNYALCKMGGNYNNNGDIYDPNNNGQNDNQGGKLTLKKVYFTYGNSTRGRLSPYEFDYKENESAYNPDYNMYARDRWGNYRPGSACDNTRFPYVNQNTSQEDIDKETSVWHLRGIKLPSGGNIEVEYESDDYAYVQEREAMQMVKIAGIGSLGYETFDDKMPSSNDLRVYFKLQNPEEYTSSSGTAVELENKLKEQYIKGQEKLYFNLEAYLRKSTDPIKDYVAGYADIVGSGLDDKANHTHGFIRLQLGKIKEDHRKFHPFNLAIMQHLRVNNPHLMNSGVEFDEEGNISKSAKAKKVQALVSMVGSIQELFKKYYNYAFDKGWGRKIELNTSYIRLHNPIQKKYGGGNRVKSIVLNDGWDAMTANESASEYGQVYNYSTESGISSGVAAYEPIVGGDEIPHRQPINFPEATPLKTRNNLYFEGPINESFFPSPTVGYSRVEVKSLALAKQEKNATPTNRTNTGSSVNEFYTAKEFPVITESTEIQKHQTNEIIPIPFLGQITSQELSLSQGYVVKLNNMHGKPKKVSNYAHDKKGNRVSLVSDVEYIYKSTNRYHNGKAIKELDNLVEVIEKDTYEKDVNPIEKLVGVDYDFFTDMRETETKSVDGGVNINSETITVPIPLPAFVPWPNIGSSTDRLRLAVTNKIIHKSGILERVVANNEGSKLITDNIYFDDLTGKPVLTSVNNNFDEKVYNYMMPAHWEYEGMGPAYENIGMRFKLPAGTNYPNNNGKMHIPVANLDAKIVSKLKSGDEFIVSGGSSLKVVYGGKEIDQTNGEQLVFWSDDLTHWLIEGSTLLLTRSGARNNLQTDMTTITALSDPTKNRVNEDCEYDVEYFEETPGTKYVIAPCVNTALVKGMNLLLNVDYSGNTHYDEFTISGGKWYEWIGGSIGNQLTYSDNTPWKIWNYKDGSKSSLIIEGENCTETSPSCGSTFQYSLVRNKFNANNFIISTDKQGNNDYQEVRDKDAILPSDPNKMCLKGVSMTLSFRVNGVPLKLRTIKKINHFYIDYSSTDYINMSSNPKGRQGLMAEVELKTGGYVYAEVGTNSDAYLDSRFHMKSPIPGVSNISPPQTQKIRTDYVKANNVLSISAQSYSDNWNHDFADTKHITNKMRNKNPYSNGQKGVWRGKSSYVYVADREQSADVNVGADGTMDNVPLFMQNAANFDLCIPGWRKVNEITQYNAYGNEVENKDILGRYSAATFSHQGDNVSAVAQNTAYRELGYEDFENYELGNIHNQFEANSSNLQFTDVPNTYVYERAEIIIAKDNVATLDYPYDDALEVDIVGVEGHYINAKTDGNFYKELEVGDFDRHPNDPNKSIIQFTNIDIDGFWDGHVNIRRAHNGENDKSINGVITDVKAHSGKHSLKTTAATFTPKYAQNGLLLKNRKYVLSACLYFKEYKK